MATWDEVRAVAMALPEASELSPRGLLEWRVRGKTFVWERPLRQSDIAALGGDAPDGPVLAAHVADLDAKDALVAEDPEVYFTTPHFNGYRAILVRLDRLGAAGLDELVVEAWLARAPKRLATAYLASKA